MAHVVRWQFSDHLETFTVPINPNQMNTPFGEKNIVAQGTMPADGRVLLWEGAPTPPTWEFSGVILTAEHYAALKEWYEKRHRVKIRDHFGRQTEVYIVHFDPTPQGYKGPTDKHYWRHEFTMRCIVLSTPTDPVVGV